MEGLIELVAASFARHGIESPAADSQLVERRASSPVRYLLVGRVCWQQGLSGAAEESSFLRSSSAWAKVRSEGTRLKQLKISVELMERFLNSRIFPVKRKLMPEISQKSSPASCW